MVIAHSYVKLPEGTFCFLSPVSAGEKNPSKTPQLSHGSTTMNVSGGHNDSLTTGTPQTWKTNKKKKPSQQHRLFFQPQGFSPQKKTQPTFAWHLHSLTIPSRSVPGVPPSRSTWASRSMLQKIVCSLATWGQGEEKSRIFQLMIHVYLVVDLPHWKMMEFVSWDYDIPNIWNNKKCSKPLTSSLLGSKGYCNGATVGLHIAQIVRFWNSSPLGHFTNIFPYDFGVVGYLSDRQQENEGYMIIYIIYKYIHTVYIYTHTVCIYIYSILYIYMYIYIG